MKCLFYRLLDTSSKSSVLRDLTASSPSAAARRFEADVRTFRVIPQSPFAYWVSERVRDAFASHPALNGQARLVVSTNPLNDDFRFARLWWEVPSKTLGRSRRPWAKGGAFSPFYYDVDTVIAWDDERSSYSGFLGTANRPLERPASVQHFFRPGLTWPRRTNGLSVRVMPRGCIFADKGPALFTSHDDAESLLGLAAICNSRAFAGFVSLRLARTELAQSYEVGLIQTIPVPELGEDAGLALSALARRAWSLRRGVDTRIETSHAFVLPALLRVQGSSLNDRAETWTARVRTVKTQLADIQAEIDERCFELYGIDQADRRALTEGFAEDVTGLGAEGSTDESEEANELHLQTVGDTPTLAAELVSWATGVAFGRFDVRLALESTELPAEPEPFDPLPVCSPGGLVGEEGLPITAPPPGYPIDFPTDGIQVDDPGDPRDLTSAVRRVFDVVFGSGADAFWDEAADLLDPHGHDLGAWVRSRFFEWHLKQYSRSRRRAPTLWQLGTPSGRYSIWLYAHRLTDDSLFQLQNDVLAPKLAFEERQATALAQSSDGSPSAKERREIEAQEEFVAELRVLFDEVRRIAPLWRPTLDDGIVLAMSPLWRLVPHKPWQRELKKRWSELAAGRYDWTQLAMYLWPERVIPKCGTDRSLAITHGLEEVFWVQDGDCKWQPRKEPTTAVSVLIHERTSAAAKAALRAVA